VYAGLIGFFLTQGPLAGRFKERPCFYPSSQGDPADVLLNVLENRPDLGRTYRPVRTIQCSSRAALSVDRLLADVLLPVET